MSSSTAKDATAPSAPGRVGHCAGAQLAGRRSEARTEPPSRDHPTAEAAFPVRRGSGLSPRPRLRLSGCWQLPRALLLRMGSLRAPRCAPGSWAAAPHQHPPGLAGPGVLWQVAWAPSRAPCGGRREAPCASACPPPGGASTDLHAHRGPGLQANEGPALPRWDRPRDFPAALPGLGDSESSVSSQELRTPPPRRSRYQLCQLLPLLHPSPYPQAGRTPLSVPSPSPKQQRSRPAARHAPAPWPLRQAAWMGGT